MKKKRIWLDDIREIPDDFNIWCTNCNEALALLESGQEIEFISFDHDLGEEEPFNGNLIAKKIEQLAFQGKMRRIGWKIHSANPVGSQNIIQTMQSAERFWDIMEGKEIENG